MKILKYEVKILEPTRVKLPAGFNVIHFHKQKDGLFFWALVHDRPEAEHFEHEFIVIATGQEIPNDGLPLYKGTCHDGPFVWHLFEKVGDERESSTTSYYICNECGDTVDKASTHIPCPQLDLINKPPHYTGGGKAIECADYIQSHDMDFFQGNAVKYLTRFRRKGSPLEDLKKARWYLDRLIEIEEKEKPHD